MSYFPMYVELKDADCIVVGGGAVALRKVQTLREFGGRICVIAPDILPEIASMADVLCRRRPFAEEDLDGADLVVVATDDAVLNHKISQACKKRRIPVNVADQIKECSFLFPAYLKAGEVVAACSTGGLSPVLAQYVKERMRPVLTQQTGEMAALLGSLRETVRRQVGTEEGRKRVYQTLLQLGQEKGELPSDEEIADAIRQEAEKWP